MIPDILPPTWFTDDQNITNTLLFENDISDVHCYFQKGNALVHHTLQFGGSPPLLVPVRGSIEAIRDDMRDFIKELLAIDGVYDLAIDNAMVIVNPNSLETILGDVFVTVQNLVSDTWNILHIDSMSYGILSDIATEEEWPELIGN